MSTLLKMGCHHSTLKSWTFFWGVPTTPHALHGCCHSTHVTPPPTMSVGVTPIVHPFFQGCTCNTLECYQSTPLDSILVLAVHKCITNNGCS